MKYTEQSFSVPTGTRDPKACEHGMVRQKDGACCFCGASKAQVTADIARRVR